MRNRHCCTSRDLQICNINITVQVFVCVVLSTLNVTDSRYLSSLGSAKFGSHHNTVMTDHQNNLRKYILHYHQNYSFKKYQSSRYLLSFDTKRTSQPIFVSVVFSKVAGLDPYRLSACAVRTAVSNSILRQRINNAKIIASSFSPPLHT